MRATPGKEMIVTTTAMRNTNINSKLAIHLAAKPSCGLTICTTWALYHFDNNGISFIASDLVKEVHMAWKPVVRPNAKFDFEDWRKAEDTQFNKKPNPQGEYPALVPRALSRLESTGDGQEYEIFWNAAEDLLAAWTDTDDRAAHADDFLRELSRLGVPEAMLMLSGFRTQLGYYDEAVRWIGRVEFLLAEESNLTPLPAGQNLKDFHAYLDAKIQDRLGDLSSALGRVPRIRQISDVGPRATCIYCGVCGMELVSGAKKVSCDGFFLDFWFDASSKQPADLLEFQKSHGSTITSTIDRWPNGIDGKLSARSF